MGKKELARIKLTKVAKAVERRGEKRCKVDILGTAHYMGATYTARLSDVSMSGGSLVVRGGVVPSGTERVHLTMYRPSGMMRIQGVVRHGKVFEDAGQHAVEMGVEFCQVSRCEGALVAQ